MKVDKPLENSYWIIPGKLLAGEYPRTKENASSRSRLEAMFSAGITRFVDLTTSEDKLEQYDDLLEEISGGSAKRISCPIPDLSTPSDSRRMAEFLDIIDMALCNGHGVYIHCWGGVGRTGTVVGCWLKRHFDGTICQAYYSSKSFGDLWKECPKSVKRPKSPETIEQQAFIDYWSEPERLSSSPTNSTWEFLPVTKAEDLGEDFITANNAIADAAREGNWDLMFQGINDRPELVNYHRIVGKSRYTPLHQAARNGAPKHVVERLLNLGAFRTLRNDKDERPLDTARRARHDHLVDLLKPSTIHHIGEGHLASLTWHFHDLVEERARDLIAEHNLKMPILDPLTELKDPVLWCPIPGMYGGFRVELKRAGAMPQIMVSSWSRVSGGSGQTHLIMPQGYVQLEDGTV